MVVVEDVPPEEVDGVAVLVEASTGADSVLGLGGSPDPTSWCSVIESATPAPAESEGIKRPCSRAEGLKSAGIAPEPERAATASTAAVEVSDEVWLSKRDRCGRVKALASALALALVSIETGCSEDAVRSFPCVGGSKD